MDLHRAWHRMRAGFLTLCLIFSTLIISAQSVQCVVSFTNKNNSGFSLDSPESYLSQRAVDRRSRQGIAIDSLDMPVNPDYIQEILNIPNSELLNQSKWFNDIVISLSDSSVLSKIREKSFVKEVRVLSSEPNKSQFQNQKLNIEFEEHVSSNTQSHYGDAFHQNHQIHVDFLHQSGSRGEGMRIAVIDAGFSEFFYSPHFNALRDEGRVIDTYDFVDLKRDVYNHSVHGTYVLSLMASETPGLMVGSAPKAEYILLRSEDAADEYILEEYFWVSAAEFADSAGSDVLNTSLGYTTFDDSTQNHSYADMDGNTTRISRAAALVANKGMLVFNSAGNSGDKPWRKISAAADAFDVISVGAVDSTEIVAPFSSRGPSYDGRIKPELVAMGFGVIIGRNDGTTGKSNGTSFSSPLLAGAATCLWQANPQKDWREIKEALLQSADRYNAPDTNYGYGLPDMLQADALLKNNSVNEIMQSTGLRVYPNPFTDMLMVVYNVASDQTAEVNMFDIQGRNVLKSNQLLQGGRIQYMNFDSEISSLSSGFYILRVNSNDFNEEIKIVKE